jgi:hypothetical protein
VPGRLAYHDSDDVSKSTVRNAAMQERDDREELAPRTANLLAYVFSAVSLALRFPLIPNFTPVGALGLFGGARMRGWRAYALPLAVMFVSDLGLWYFYKRDPFDPFVYGSFMLSVLLGRLLVRTNSPLKIGTVAVASSLQFFLITNFGCWLTMSDRYPRSLAGLADCYVKGIPFYGSTLAGDLIYSAVFFGVYAWVTAMQRQPARVAA